MALAIGGMGDHTHALLLIPPHVAVSKVVQVLKGNTFKWINETSSSPNRFTWQEGYAAFAPAFLFTHQREEETRIHAFSSLLHLLSRKDAPEILTQDDIDSVPEFGEDVLPQTA